MPRFRCFSRPGLGLALAASLSGSACAAAAPDRDYELITPAAPPSPPAPRRSPSANPPGFDTSPLVIAAVPVGPRPRMRFVTRDGSVLVGQVLGFDGRMYALRLPHETVLVRADFLIAVTPAPTGPPPGTRPARVRTGARF